MRVSKSIQLKAAFLLVVFSLNTVAGFACSIGVDMGYNAKHHEQGSISEEKSHEHSSIHKHNHDEHTEKLATGRKMKSSSDDCCSNEVIKFIQLDKSVVHNHFFLQAPIFLIAFTSTFLIASQNENSFAVNSKFQFVRRS